MIVNVHETAVWHINLCFEDITNLFSKNNHMLSFLQCMSDEHDQMHRQSQSLKKFNHNETMWDIDMHFKKYSLFEPKQFVFIRLKRNEMIRLY